MKKGDGSLLKQEGAVFALMKTLILILAALVLLSATVEAASSIITVTATVLSQNQCNFRTANAALNFGTIDPATSSDVSASASVVVRCVGHDPIATFFITDDDGLYESGPNQHRMMHSSMAEYLPYEFSLSPESASIPKNTDFTVTINGIIRASAHQNAWPGSYTDTVVLSIMP